MGRAACHLGRTVTWDEITHSDFQFCPDLDHLDYDSPAFVRADDQGPLPGSGPGTVARDLKKM